jgi:beta-mannosidase
MDERGVPSTFADRNIGMLLGVVKTYSPHVVMLPTSASGPNEFGNPANVGENHDIHGSWKYMGVEGHYTYFNTIDSLFHSEFGVDGMSSVETLKTCLSPENLKPSNMAENYVWRHHGEWWDTSARDNGIFGVPQTLEQQVARSQFIQAEGLRYAVEANRRRAYENSGSIIWQGNELYPNVSSTSLLDCYINQKPAFRQVAKAFAPLNVSIRYDKLVYSPGEIVRAEVFVTRDNDEREVSVTAKSGDTVLTGKATVGNGLSASIGVLELVANGKFIDITLTGQDGELSYENTIRLLVKQNDGLCSDEGIAGFY